MLKVQSGDYESADVLIAPQAKGKKEFKESQKGILTVSIIMLTFAYSAAKFIDKL